MKKNVFNYLKKLRLIIALLLISGGLSAQYNLTFEVIDADYNLVEGAVVTINPGADNQQQLTTDASGTVVFNDMPDGISIPYEVASADHSIVTSGIVMAEDVIDTEHLESVLLGNFDILNLYFLVTDPDGFPVMDATIVVNPGTMDEMIMQTNSEGIAVFWELQMFEDIPYTVDDGVDFADGTIYVAGITGSGYVEYVILGEQFQWFTLFFSVTDGTNPLSNVDVTIFPGDSEMEWTQTTAADGLVQFGEYTTDMDIPYLVDDGMGNTIENTVYGATVEGTEHTEHIVLEQTAENTAPVITSSPEFSVEENQTFVGMVVAEDAEDDILTFSISGGADSGLFDVSGGELIFLDAPDYENPADADQNNIYTVEITVTDDGEPALSATQTVTITVTDAAENTAPVITSTAEFSVPENQTLAATITAEDDGETLTFSISGGADAAAFTISATGELSFNSAPDYENPDDTNTDNVYEVEITVTDDGEPALSATQTVTITVTDVDDMDPPGNAIHFDGVDEYAIIEGTSEIKDNFTVEMWFKTTSSKSGHLLSSRMPTKDYSFDIQLIDGYKIHGDIGNGSSWLTNNADADFNYANGQWHHLAYVVTQTGYIIYIDGKSVKTGNYSGSPVLRNSNFKIYYTQHGVERFTGDLDEVRIWSKALTETEIHDNMYNELVGNEEDLEIYHNFNQTTGNSISDISGNGNTATLYNMDNTNWKESYALVTTMPLGGTYISPYSFVANWSALSLGTLDGFYLDVDDNSDFSSPIVNKQEVAPSFATIVSGLSPNTTYYYRVRPFKTGVGEGVFHLSSPMSVTTSAAMSAPGNALTFGSGKTEFVEVPDLHLTNNTYTIEAWIKPTGTQTDWTGIVMTRNSDYANGLFIQSNRELRYNWNGIHFDWSSGLIAENDKWNHVALVVEPTKATLYLNGKSAVNTANHTVETVVAPTYIGNDPYYLFDGNATERNFNGAIDEVRVYNYAKQASAIQATMYKELTDSETGLISYFNFNMPSALILPDLKSGKYGTLTNMTGSEWTESYAMVTPVPAAATGITSLGFTANWSAPALGSVTGYYLDIDDNQDFSSPIVNRQNVTGATSYAVTGLTPNTNYYYRVRAYKTGVADGAFHYSSPVMVKTFSNQPVITVTSNMTPFVTEYGTNSAVQSFSVSGKYLSDNIHLQPLNGFEYSLDNESFSNEIRLFPTAGTVQTTPVYVRLKGATAGTFGGNILCTTPDATDKTVAVSGTVNERLITPGNALNFDGSGNYVDCGIGINTALVGTNKITVEAWAKLNEYGTYSTIVGNYSGGMQFILRVDNKKPSFFVNTGTFMNVLAPDDLPLNEWTHLAGTWDGTTMRIFVNGIEKNSVAASGKFPTNSNSVKIGRNGTTEIWKGDIDEVRIWNTAKPDFSIHNTMYSELIGNEPNLLAYYNFNKTTGTVLPDLTGRYNGTLTEMTGSEWVESYAMVAPTLLDASAVSASGFTVNWTASKVGTVNNYFVEVAKDKNFTLEKQQFDAGTGTSYTVTGLAQGTEYYYRVRANKNSVANSGALHFTAPKSVKTATSVVLSPPGNALNFDGINEYVEITNNGLQIEGTFTIEAWVKPMHPTNSLTVLSSRSTEFGFDMKFIGGNRIHADIGDGSKWLTITADANFDYEAGKWYHVAFVVHPAYYSIYVNGILAGGSFINLQGAVLINDNHILRIGQGFGGGEMFKGQIDEVRVWNKDLYQGNPGTGEGIYSQLTGSEDGLMAYFDFNQVSGTSLPDIAGGDNNGNLVNMEETDWSESYAMITPICNEPTSITDSGFTLSWNAPSIGTVENYYVEIATDKAFKQNFKQFNAGNNTSYTFDGLNDGTEYYYRVRANKASVEGCGGWHSSLPKTIKIQKSSTPGNSLSFDGVDDFINAGNSFDLVNKSFTIEFWARPTEFGNLSYIVGYGSTVESNQYLQIGFNQFNSFSFGFTNNELNVDVKYTDGLWHHWACVYYANTTGTDRYVYRDGVLVASDNANGNFIGAGSLFIGSLAGPNTFFKGNIDELRIWDYAKKPGDLAESMYSPLTGSENGLLAYYNFDETSGTVLNDLSPLSTYNNGTLTNMTNEDWVESYAMVAPAVNPASNITPTSFDITWTKPGTGVVDKYFVEIATNEEFTHNLSVTDVGKATSYSVTDLTPNRTYFYRVKAYKESVKDQSSYHHPGLRTVTLPGPLPAPGYAMSFDGVEELVQLDGALNTSLNYKTSFTVEAWVKPTEAKTFATIAGNYTTNYFDNSGNFMQYLLRLDYGKPFFAINNAAYSVVTDNALPYNQWSHVAGVWDGSNLKIYVNGQLVKSAPTPNGSLVAFDPTYAQRIGSSYVLNEFFTGQIDEVKIWSAARTQTEIQNSMYSEFTSNQSELVAYFPFRNPDFGPINNFPGTPATLNKMDDANWVESYAMVCPVLNDATNPTRIGFDVSWSAPEVGAVDNYIVEVATDIDFTLNYHKYDAGKNTSLTIDDLLGSRIYYYRVKANKSSVNGSGGFHYSSPKSQMVGEVMPPGYALDFDGVNEFVTCGTGINSLIKNSNVFTLEAWVNPAYQAAFNTSIVGDYQQASGNNLLTFLLQIELTTHKPRFFLGANYIDAGEAIPINQWTHLAATYDGSTMKLYINGKLSAQKSGVSYIFPEWAGTVFIGTSSFDGNPGDMFPGKIDEIRLWKSARTETDIRNSMYNELVGNETNLISYYNFNHAKGATLTDNTGKGNNGTLINMEDIDWVESYAMVAPEMLPANNITPEGFDINWNAPITGFYDEYIIEISDNIAFSKIMKTLNADKTETSQTVDGLLGAKTYYFRVKAEKSSVPKSGTVHYTAPQSVLTDDPLPPGYALHFDGNNEYVQTSSTTNIVDNFTVEAWVKPEKTGNLTFLSSRKTEHGFDLKFSNNKISADIGNGTGWLSTNLKSNSDFAPGVWYHVACVVTKTGATLYVNGRHEGQVTYNSSSPVLTNSNHTVQIGTVNGTGEMFKGEIDEVRIWNTARKLDDIKNNMYIELPSSTTNLVDYYNFNTPTDQLIDLAGGDNNGTRYEMNDSNWVESYAMVVPEILPETEVSAGSFVANWKTPAIGKVDGYLIEVSKNEAFTDLVLTLKDIGLVNSYKITGLQSSREYYYKVRAYKSNLGNTGALHFSSPKAVRTDKSVEIYREFKIVDTDGNNLDEATFKIFYQKLIEVDGMPPYYQRTLLHELKTDANGMVRLNSDTKINIWSGIAYDIEIKGKLDTDPVVNYQRVYGETGLETITYNSAVLEAGGFVFTAGKIEKVTDNKYILTNAIINNVVKIDGTTYIDGVTNDYATLKTSGAIDLVKQTQRFTPSGEKEYIINEGVMVPKTDNMKFALNELGFIDMYSQVMTISNDTISFVAFPKFPWILGTFMDEQADKTRSSTVNAIKNNKVQQFINAGIDVAVDNYVANEKVKGLYSIYKSEGLPFIAISESYVGDGDFWKFETEELKFKAGGFKIEELKILYDELDSRFAFSGSISWGGDDDEKKKKEKEEEEEEKARGFNDFISELSSSINQSQGTDSLEIQVVDANGTVIYSTIYDEYTDISDQIIQEDLRRGLPFEGLSIDFEIVQGIINRLIITVDAEIPIPGTGLSITKLGGGVDDLAEEVNGVYRYKTSGFLITAMLNLGITGDESNPPMVSAEDLTLQLRPFSYFSASGTLKVYGSEMAYAGLSYNNDIQLFKAVGTINFYDILLGGMGLAVQGGDDPDITGSAFLNAYVPSWVPWPFGGMQVASAMIGANKTLVAGKVSLGFDAGLFDLKIRAGLGYHFVKKKPLWGSNIQVPQVSMDLRRGDTRVEQFVINNDTRQLIIFADNPNQQDVPFTLKNPEGINVLNNENCGFNNEKKYRLAYIEIPEKGTWTLEYNEATYPDTRIKTMFIDNEPSGHFTSPVNQNAGSAEVAMKFNDTNDTLNVDVFIDNDKQDYDGKKIATFKVLNNAGIKFNFSGDGLNPGEYFFYYQMADKSGIPVFQYAPGSLLVEGNPAVAVPLNLKYELEADSMTITWNKPESTDIVYTSLILDEIATGKRYQLDIATDTSTYFKEVVPGRKYNLTAYNVGINGESEKVKFDNILYDNNTNLPPVWEDAPYVEFDFVTGVYKEYDLNVVDPEGDNVTLSLVEPLPKNFAINGDVISWTAEQADAGIYQFHLVASDGTNKDTLQVNIRAFMPIQRETSVSFPTRNLYEADNMYLIIEDWNTEAEQIDVMVYNRTKGESISVQANKVDEGKFLAHFQLSYYRRSILPVSDGDEIEAVYTVDGTDYTSKAYFESTPQVVDNEAPNAITDLSIVNFNEELFMLIFTTPQDTREDKAGMIFAPWSYDLRYNYSVLDNEDLYIASEDFVFYNNKQAGVPDTIFIKKADLIGYDEHHKIWFNIKAADSKYNYSDLSNTVSYNYISEPAELNAEINDKFVVALNWKGTEVIPDDESFNGYRISRRYFGKESEVIGYSETTEFTDTVPGEMADGILVYDIVGEYAIGETSEILSNQVDLERYTNVNFSIKDEANETAVFDVVCTPVVDYKHFTTYNQTTDSEGDLRIANMVNTTYAIEAFYNNESLLTDEVEISPDNDVFNYIFTSSTSVESINESTKISVYPNPANELLTIDLDRGNGRIVEYYLVAENGRVVKQSNHLRRTKELKLNISDVAVGNYVLIVKTNKQMFAEKVMIIR